MGRDAAIKPGFWEVLDRLVAESELVIDRPKGSVHWRYPDYVYPLDYGYLEGTSSMDGDGIDVWIGSDSDQSVKGILCTVDLVKRDSEIKILLGCTEDEILLLEREHNVTDLMKGVLVRKPPALPEGLTSCCR